MAAVASNDDPGAEDAAQRLGLLVGEQQNRAILSLRQLARSPESEIRWWAIRGLSAIRSKETTPLLVEKLIDPSPAVRRAAALGLCLHPDKSAIPDLIKTLEETDQLTAQLAEQALTAIGSEAVEPLISALRRYPTNNRHLIVRCLAMIGDERSLKIFYGLLDDESILVRYWANEGLERLGVGTILFKP